MSGRPLTGHGDAGRCSPQPTGEGGWGGGWGHRPHHEPHLGAPFWRRRFLRFAIVVGAVWIGTGLLFGVVVNNDGAEGRSGPPPGAALVVVAALAATVVAYRRVARPVSGLLDAAGRVGAGDYSARVRPDGPRSVRSLGQAFNDMAGRLDASEEARRRFLADVTHELRTPLAVLQGGVEAQLDGIHRRDDAHLTTLLEQTRTLARLVEDLRTLALGDAGQLTISTAPTDLGDVVAEAVAAMGAMGAERGVAIVTHRAGPDATAPITVVADRGRLVQVLTNLLTNAVRHTPVGGTVTVTVTATSPPTAAATSPPTAASATLIHVDDTGAGIAGDPERVFDRFVRADTGGSGLGLTIARQLVEAHGGTISASNRAGAGARFTIALPSAPA